MRVSRLRYPRPPHHGRRPNRLFAARPGEDSPADSRFVGSVLPKEARHQNTRRLSAEEVFCGHVTDAPRAERFAQTRRGDVSYGNEAPSAGRNHGNGPNDGIAVAIDCLWGTNQAICGGAARAVKMSAVVVITRDAERGAGQAESRWPGPGRPELHVQSFILGFLLSSVPGGCKVHGETPSGEEIQENNKESEVKKRRPRVRSDE